MKKTVKILSLLLVVVLFAGMALASGSSGSSSSSSSSSSSDVKAPTSVSSSDSSASTEKETASAAAASSKSSSVTVEEAVLVDENGIKITATGFDDSGLFGPAVKLLVENSSSQNLSVQARNLSVNGYMVEDMFSCDVAAGKKANDTLTLSSSDLETCGIDTIAKIELQFHVFNTDSWDTVFDSDMVTIETSAAAGYTYSFDDSGNSVYDNGGVKIVVKGLSEDSSIFGPSIVVYIANESGQNVTVQCQDVSVNGFMVESIFSCDVTNGKCAIDTITFMSSDLEANNISSVDDVELSFHIFNEDSWDTIADSNPVTISFN